MFGMGLVVNLLDSQSLLSQKNEVFKSPSNLLWSDFLSILVFVLPNFRQGSPTTMPFGSTFQRQFPSTNYDDHRYYEQYQNRSAMGAESQWPEMGFTNVSLNTAVDQSTRSRNSQDYGITVHPRDYSRHHPEFHSTSHQPCLLWK